MKHRPLRERFEEKYIPEPNSGCWLWLGAINTDGRGLIKEDCKNRPLKTHRAAWMIYRGEIPVGMHVLHRCDLPCCVNPDHLFLGTHKDNMSDMTRKRRQAVGSRHGMSKLTEAQVAEIKQAKGSWGIGDVLARRFSVSPMTVSMIRGNKSWTHV